MTLKTRIVVCPACGRVHAERYFTPTLMTIMVRMSDEDAIGLPGGACRDCLTSDRYLAGLEYGLDDEAQRFLNEVGPKTLEALLVEHPINLYEVWEKKEKVGIFAADSEMDAYDAMARSASFTDHIAFLDGLTSGTDGFRPFMPELRAVPLVWKPVC